MDRLPWQLFAASFISTGLAGIVGVTAPGIRASFGVGYVAIGAVFVTQTLGALIGAGVVGIVPHRVLELRVLALIASAGLAAVAVAPTYGVIVPAMCLAGLGGFALITRAQADLSALAGQRRAHALSILHVCGGVGATFFPLAFGGMLLLGASWRSAFVLLAAAYAAYHVSVSRLELREGASRLSSARSLTSSARWAATVAVLGMAVQVTVPLWLPTLLHDRFGASQAQASLGAAMYFLALLVGRAGGARLLRQLGEQRELRLGIAVAAIGYVVLALATSGPMLVLGAALIGAGVGPLLPLGVARTAQVTGDDRLASSLVMSTASLAQIALPALVLALLLGLSLHASLSATGAVVGLMAVAERASASAVHAGSLSAADS